MKEKLIIQKNYPCGHFTSVKACGNMKDEFQRNSLLRSLGMDEKSLVLARQVHCINVQTVTAENKGNFIEDCDGLITSDKNIMLAVFTADCMPVLMVSKDKRVRAAVHAGWRGLAGGILQKAVKIFKEEFGVDPDNIAAYVGPHIQECCYEVSADLGKVFNVKLKNGKLDLSAIAKDIFTNEGVNDIYINGNCSCCESDIFFSYRKDKTDGRMITLLASE